jgi:hypothetical protein
MHLFSIEILFAVKLTSEPDFPKFLEGELLAKLKQWPQANAHYKRILTQE